MLRKLSELLFGKNASQAFSNLMPQQTLQQRLFEKQKEYIAREGVVGARLLGPIPSGHDREFFCLDRNTWIWHESWKEGGTQHEFTVNYEVDPSGILKRVNGGPYELLKGEELARFDRAIRAYYEEVGRQVYDRRVATA